LSKAPAPAVITTTNPKRKKINTPPKTARSHGISFSTIILSNSVKPVRLAIFITRQPSTNNIRTAKNIPSTPQLPNTAKNWVNSCPDTKPAPKKLPVKAMAICRDLRPFMYNGSRP
jgi:hypothetical protein